MDRQVVAGFFDDLEKNAEIKTRPIIRSKMKQSSFGGDIDDLYAAPSSSLMPALKRAHNLGKSSSWTDIGPVGQREGRGAHFQRVPWDKEKRGFAQVLLESDLEELREKTAAKPAGIKIMYVGKEFGSGHISQARNIEAAAKKRGIDTEMIDFNRKFGKPGSRQRYERAFRQNLKRPSILGAAKVLGNHFRHHFTGIDKGKLLKYTDANKDHAIVVTNPHLRSSMGGVKQPIHVLHTDPEAWAGEVAINPRKSKHIHLGTKDAVGSLIGWDEKKALTGLPIHPDILKRGKKTGLMRPGRLNVTVSGGGLGLDVAEMTKNVLKGLPEKSTVHAVAGRNRRAMRTLKSLAKKDPRVQPHGFAPLGQMMREADLNILRAHGTSFQESVAAGKPSVYYAPDAGLSNMQGKLTKNTALYGERTMKQPAAIGMERLPGVTAGAVERRGELRRRARVNQRALGNPADEAVRFIMKDRPEYEEPKKRASAKKAPSEGEAMVSGARKGSRVGAGIGAATGLGAGALLARQYGRLPLKDLAFLAAGGGALGATVGGVAGGLGGSRKAMRKSRKLKKVAYKLQGHADVQGLRVAIENRKGSVRKGRDSDGNEWRTKMKFPYGYLVGTKGADDEPVDVYVGPEKDAPDAYVVHQHKDTGKGYDEDKVMLAFPSKAAAKKAFLAHYDSEKFLGPISRVSVDRLRALVKAKKRLVKIR